MRSGSNYIKFFIFITLLAACNKESHPPPALQCQKDAESVETPAQFIHHQHNPTFSRFQSASGVLSDTDQPYRSTASANDEYYIIRENISKLKNRSCAKALDSKRNIHREGLILKKSGDAPLLSFASSSKLSPDVYFIAVFDNDIFDYTDYYYTNGIRLELFHPIIASSLISSALPGLKGSNNYYSVSLVQNLYTPLKLEDLEPRLGDRPFASYLAVGHIRISLSPVSQRRLESEFVLGILGPASMGRIAQDMIHEHEPIGWINQVSNDIIVNYNIRFEQGVYKAGRIEAVLVAGGQAGTLYDNISAGACLQLGKTNNRFGEIFQTTSVERPFKKRIRYYFTLEMKNTLMFYDATLQGGMFNKDNPYTLDAGQVKRYIFSATAYVGIGLGKYSLEAEQVFLTPEFTGGRHHLWFRIKNVIRLN